MKHLLDILWERVGCDYLSDLKSEKMRKPVVNEIRTIPKEEYSINMWNETLSYIYGRHIIITSTKDVESVINLPELQT